MTAERPVIPVISVRAGVRAGALALTALALAATTVPPREECRTTNDAAEFDAATSCGPAGVVALRSEVAPPGAGGCEVTVYADGGPAVGLPARGEIVFPFDGPVHYPVDYPGDSLLRTRITLEGAVALLDAVPATTVTRACRTQRASRNVLSVVCEGPDPEAACSGTLSIRPPVTP